MTRCSIAGTKIPAGSLIAHLQRALNYVQAEVNLTEDGLPAEVEDLETIEALTLIESVQPEVCEQRRQQLRARLRENRQQAQGADAWQQQQLLQQQQQTTNRLRQSAYRILADTDKLNS